MKIKTLIGVFFVLWGSALNAQAGETAVQRWTANPAVSHIEFMARSSLHNVHGTARLLSGEIIKGTAGRFVFPVDSMDTANNARDRKMVAMFEAEKYPEIIYEIHTLTESATGENGTVSGTLTMHGVTLDFPLEVDIIKIDENKRDWQGGADISLQRFNLKPPSVLGLIRVADSVHVTFDIVLEKEQ